MQALLIPMVLINAKGGGSEYYIRTGMTENDFFKPYPPKYDPITDTYTRVD